MTNAQNSFNDFLLIGKVTFLSGSGAQDDGTSAISISDSAAANAAISALADMVLTAISSEQQCDFILYR